MSKPTFFLWLVFFVCTTFIASAQQTDSSARKLKNEIAVDVSSIFSGSVANNVLPGIIYRRHYQKGALRARLNVSGGKTDTQNTNSVPNVLPVNSTDPSSNFVLTARLGYQWHRDFDKFRWYYGMDAVASINNSKTQQSIVQNYGPNIVNARQYTTQMNSYGLSPLMGITYQFSRHFSASVETAFSALYIYATSNVNSSTTTDNGYGQITTIQNSETSQKTTGTNFRFTPINGFLISYHF